jgi:5-hydroxyisourate hydrolase
MSDITTYVLDTARGQPASGVPIALEVRAGNSWRRVGRGMTDAEGRAHPFTASTSPSAGTGREARADWDAGTYRLIFDTGAYHRAQGVQPFFPEVAVVFEVRDAGQHHELLLQLSPFGYSTCCVS